MADCEGEAPLLLILIRGTDFGLNFACDDLLNQGLATDYRSRRHGCVLRGG